MPTGPKGQKRPGDVIGAAIMVGRIATGDIEESAPADDGTVVKQALRPATRMLTTARRAGIRENAVAAIGQLSERRTRRST